MKKTALKNWSYQLSNLGLKCASDQAKSVRLPSGVGVLDDYLEGGVPVGTVTEWGMPIGRQGREVVLRWLARSSSFQEKCLWISSNEDRSVYPPAWLARGVSLREMRFVVSSHPVTQLKPVFMEPVFKIIVIDDPEYLSIEECAFLSHQARNNGQAIFILRNWFLSPKKGNIWAKMRLNCWQNSSNNKVHFKTIKGLVASRLSFKSSLLNPAE